MPQRQQPASRLKRSFSWLGDHVGSAIIAAAVGAVATLLVAQHQGGSPPTIGEQVDGIRRDAARGGFTAVVNRPVDLHGSGVRSRLFIFQSPEPDLSLAEFVTELAVYDERHGRLVRTFRFRPKTTAAALDFSFFGVGHFDGTDRNEMIGTFWQIYEDASFARPVTLVWKRQRTATSSTASFPPRRTLRTSAHQLARTATRRSCPTDPSR